MCRHETAPRAFHFLPPLRSSERTDQQVAEQPGRRGTFGQRRLTPASGVAAIFLLVQKQPEILGCDCFGRHLFCLAISRGGFVPSHTATRAGKHLQTHWRGVKHQNDRDSSQRDDWHKSSRLPKILAERWRINWIFLDSTIKKGHFYGLWSWSSRISSGPGSERPFWFAYCPFFSV